MKITREYYNQLVDNLIKYEDQYYNKDDSEISDSEFDSLYNEALQIEKQHKDWIRIDSPTRKVMGAPTKGLQEIVHDVPMLSLGKAMDMDELYNEIRKMYNAGSRHFFIECKHDGLACRLKYNKGKLLFGATRGNGKVGNDVTLTCKQIENIPKELPEPIDLDIRGEIFLTKSGLNKINKYIQEHFPKQKLKKNVRNTASGLLRDENPDVNKSKYLKFSAYMALTDDISHSASMRRARELGFQTTVDFVKTHLVVFDDKKTFDDNFNEIKIILNNVADDRSNLDFDIDGMVIKSDLYVDQQKLGSREEKPNWAIAYKFPQEEKMSILKDVRWDLGPKGNITPVALIEPVEILGATVENPTLHNIDEIKRLDIKIGDHITVTRRGDVIPKVIRSHPELRTGDEKEIIIPDKCPVCGGPVTKQDVFIRCDNINCKGRIAGRVLDFINKLEIKDFGEKLINKLVELNKIKSIVDIYKLVEKDISTLDKQGDTSAKKVISRINQSKSATLDKVLAGLGIPNIGDTTGKQLAKFYGTLDKFQKATFEELLNMDDIGELTATSILKWIKNNNNLINELIKLNIGQPLPTALGKLNGKTFAFTGTLSISRKKMQETIESNGGINSSIKKGLDYLIIGAGAKDHKIEKAKSLNANVITEDEFYKLIK